MNVRRHAAIGFAALTGACLVAACGSTSMATPTPKTASSASSSPTAAAVQTGNPSAAVTLSEAGSSLLYPYLQKLAPGINAAYPNITLTPAAGGSGTGQSEAISGTIDMGGSDAYLSPAQFTANSGILNIPIAVSSQAVNYNLAGDQQPEAERQRAGPDLLGHHHHLEQRGDRRPQPRGDPAQHHHHPDPALRLVG